MAFITENLTIEEFIHKLKRGATLRFKNDKATEFLEVFKFWNPNTPVTTETVGDKTTIKI